MKRLLASALLALSSVAFGATLTPVQNLNPAGSTIGQAVVSTGASTAPAWGNVTATALAPQAANTVMANATGSTASPTAFAMPSCSGTNNALRWTSGSGFTCASSIALTTGALSQFAATTSAQLAGVISDETGSGSLVFGTSPTISGAAISSPTLSGTVAGTPTFSGAIAFSSTITPSQTAGIVGTTTNNSANAGSVGETVSQTVPAGSAVSLTTTTATTVAQISLTAGQWDVCGTVWFNPGSTTVSSLNIGWISTGTTAALPTSPNNGGETSSTSSIAPGSGTYSLPVGCQVLKLAATTTVYLGAFSAFTTSTNAAFGFIGAERRR